MPARAADFLHACRKDTEELLHRLEGARAELGEDGVIVDVRVLGNKIGADLDVFTIGQELLMG